MTYRESRKAEQLLAPYSEMRSVVSLDGGGVAITGEWRDGSQFVFYALDTVQARIREFERRATTREN